MQTESQTQSGGWSDRAAEIWETRFEPQRGLLFAGVVGATKLKPGSMVLDAGCGGGGIALAASERGARVFGCDLSEGVLAAAQMKVPTGEFKVGNLVALPYDGNTFDTVIACDSLLSPNDAADAIAELSRVCKPDGEICIAVWGAPSESDYSRVLDAMQSLLPQKPAVTPLALSGQGVIESHIGPVGLRIRHEEIVSIDYRFQTFEDYWACGKELAGIKLIAQVAGEERARQTALLAAQPSIKPNGQLVMKHTYRLVLLSAKPE